MAHCGAAVWHGGVYPKRARIRHDTNQWSCRIPFRDNAGRITQVIYQDNLGDHVDFWDYRNDKRKSSYAVRRTYIDIGAGVPGWDDSEDGASGGVND